MQKELPNLEVSCVEFENVLNFLLLPSAFHSDFVAKYVCDSHNF